MPRILPNKMPRKTISSKIGVQIAELRRQLRAHGVARDRLGVEIVLTLAQRHLPERALVKLPDERRLL